MRLKIFICFALVLSLSLFVFTACSDDDDDKGKSYNPTDILNPEDIDIGEIDLYIAVVEFMDDYHRNSNYEAFILVFDQEISQSDLTLNINGSPVPVEGMFGFWYIDEYPFEEGANYLFEVSVAGKSYSISVKTPYGASSTTFPQSYNSQQAANVSWTLANDNENQIASAYSDHWDNDLDEYSEWFREISKSARQFTFPANVVHDYGEGTMYELSIMQLNFKVSGKVMVLGMSDRYQDYGDYRTRSKERTANTLRNVVEMLK